MLPLPHTQCVKSVRDASVWVSADLFTAQDCLSGPARARTHERLAHRDTNAVQAGAKKLYPCLNFPP